MTSAITTIAIASSISSVCIAAQLYRTDLGRASELRPRVRSLDRAIDALVGAAASTVSAASRGEK